jgi:hypothetical protein
VATARHHLLPPTCLQACPPHAPRQHLIGKAALLMPHCAGPRMLRHIDGYAGSPPSAWDVQPSECRPAYAQGACKQAPSSRSASPHSPPPIGHRTTPFLPPGAAGMGSRPATSTTTRDASPFSRCPSHTLRPEGCPPFHLSSTELTQTSGEHALDLSDEPSRISSGSGNQASPLVSPLNARAVASGPPRRGVAPPAPRTYDSADDAAPGHSTCGYFPGPDDPAQALPTSPRSRDPRAGDGRGAAGSPVPIHAGGGVSISYSPDPAAASAPHYPHFAGMPMVQLNINIPGMAPQGAGPESTRAGAGSTRGSPRDGSGTFLESPPQGGRSPSPLPPTEGCAGTATAPTPSARQTCAAWGEAHHPAMAHAGDMVEQDCSPRSTFEDTPATYHTLVRR